MTASHAHRAGRVRLSSLRDVVVPLAGLNLVTGPNGSGKSNLYRALRLLADMAQGRVIPSLAREGGLASMLWAVRSEIARSVQAGEHAVQGTRRKGPISLRLGFASDDFGYAIDLGLPIRRRQRFGHDPEIKRRVRLERARSCARPPCSSIGADRSVTIARQKGELVAMLTQGLASFDSLMTHCADPEGTPRGCCCCASRCAAGASTITSAPTPRRRRACRRSGRTRRCSATTALTWRRRSRRSA